MTERRWLNADEAAAYLSISVDGFRRKVCAGVNPGPSRALGTALVGRASGARDEAMRDMASWIAGTEMIKERLNPATPASALGWRTLTNPLPKRCALIL